MTTAAARQMRADVARAKAATAAMPDQPTYSAAQVEAFVVQEVQKAQAVITTPGAHRSRIGLPAPEPQGVPRPMTEQEFMASRLSAPQRRAERAAQRTERDDALARAESDRIMAALTDPDILRRPRGIADTTEIQVRDQQIAFQARAWVDSQNFEAWLKQQPVERAQQALDAARGADVAMRVHVEGEGARQAHYDAIGATGGPRLSR